MSAPSTAVGPVPLSCRPFDDLLTEAAALHGHVCPGQVLGVRMVLAGCREVGLDVPQAAGKQFVVFVEIDRCATDAIQALTGVSLGKRTLKHVDFGKMAATFVNLANGRSVRVAARDDARNLVPVYAPGEVDMRRAQQVAYGTMPERELLTITPVSIRPGWLDRKRVRVLCDWCGEGVNYQREVTHRGQTLCRACAGARYCEPVLSTS